MDGSRAAAGTLARWCGLAAAIGVLAVALAAGCSNGPRPSPVVSPAASGSSVASAAGANPSVDLPALCACDERYGPVAPMLDPTVLPVDVSLKDNRSCPAASCRPCFACYAWQLFIALSWPSQLDGGPDRYAPFGAAGDRGALVWGRFRNIDTLFSDEAPTPWQPASAAAKALGPLAKLRATDQADHLWLTDRNGELVRYEIRINRDGFDYIRENKLYHQAGLLRAFDSGAGVEFPAEKSRYGPHGVIEVKAAWAMVPAGEEQRFAATHKVAEVMLPGESTSRLAALVGLHIAKKTPHSPQWIWATFEHRDNAPDEVDAGLHPKRSYTFYNSALPADWTPDQDHPPDPYASPPTPKTRPVQLTRHTPIDPRHVMPINRAMQALIAARYPESIWRNYQLVGVQWPQRPVNQYDRRRILPTGAPEPEALANLTMESYMQKPGRGGGSPDGTSSCIGCHAKAAITPTFDPSLLQGKPGVFGWTDYSAIFLRARNQPASATDP